MSELQIRLVREQITDFLRHEILTGKFEEGEPLREAGLAARFNVSRGPIRDALLQLTKEGLLEARRNCGARVGRVWDEDVRPVMANLRIEIETFAMRELMEHGPAASLKYFRDNLRNFEVA